ncbi:hypothetical protein [Paenibacillus medicaginis]|uniref:Uncharacterized protein n=1 Tax=Paenibacillus medicaginis TaxID=1470560 RepID=A0ABV5C0Q7_9BACL
MTKTVLQNWTTCWTDFYSESFPPDPDSADEDEDEPEEDEGNDHETDWLELWALCISNGITDSEWPNMTIPKIRALMKAKNKNREFEIILHGGKVENKKPKKARKLSDLGFFGK